MNIAKEIMLEKIEARKRIDNSCADYTGIISPD